MMRKSASSKKTSKAITKLGIDALDDECKTCIYYKKSACKGQFKHITPCLFAKKEAV